MAGDRGHVDPAVLHRRRFRASDALPVPATRPHGEAAAHEARARGADHRPDWLAQEHVLDRHPPGPGHLHLRHLLRRGHRHGRLLRHPHGRAVALRDPAPVHAYALQHLHRGLLELPRLPGVDGPALPGAPLHGLPGDHVLRPAQRSDRRHRRADHTGHAGAAEGHRPRGAAEEDGHRPHPRADGDGHRQRQRRRNHRGGDEGCRGNAGDGGLPAQDRLASRFQPGGAAHDAGPGWQWSA
mmetsp:Transcript_39943/g.124453  ORF Transcript_39943/g.124453 Transcript_39943/m.124453 type:complete len:240 (-) Transcript_39943:655-1374(-)